MTTPRKPRGPYRKGIERREQILETAFEVFAQHGDRGLSLQEIADRIGITQPALLHYFDSRDELLLAVLERRDALGAQAAYEHEVTSSGEQVIESVRYNMGQPGLIQLYITLMAAATNPAHHGHDFFVDRYTKIPSMLSRGLEKDQRNGVIRRDEQADQMGRLLLALMDGLQVQWLLDPTTDVVALLETFLRLCQDPSDHQGA